MLTAFEENVLRKMLEDRTPTPCMNPTHIQSEVGNTAQATGQHIQKLIANWRPTHVTGAVLPPTDNRVPLTPLSDDTEFMKSVKHVLRKGEKAIQFIARTGLSPAQAATMSKNQITQFVAQAEQNAKDLDHVTTKHFEPRPMPSKMRIAVDTW